MDRILIKHVTNLLKLTLPNINIMLDNDNMKKLLFVYYYEKDNTNIFPRLFDADSDINKIYLYGEINLDDYPIKAPQTILYGDIAHCHVYKSEGTRYRICYSLDRSFEWYFKSSQSSIFNPSLTLVHYVVNIYRFIAEDDRLHTISKERTIQSLDYWNNYNKTIEVPYTELAYNDAVSILNNILYCSMDCIKNSMYIDYIDKSDLLTSFKNIIIPINHITKNGKICIEITDLCFTKLDYYECGIRKTSYGNKFTNYLPVVAKSDLWNKDEYITLMRNQLNDIYNANIKSPLITTKNKNIKYELVYTLFEIINELVLDIIKDGKIKTVKLDMYAIIYHILIYLDNELNDTFIDIIDTINNLENVREYMVPNIMVIIGILLYKHTLTDAILSEFITRITYRAVHQYYAGKKYVDFNDNKFSRKDMSNWKYYLLSVADKYIKHIEITKKLFMHFKSIHMDDIRETFFNKELVDDINSICNIYSNWDILNIDNVDIMLDKSFEDFNCYYTDSSIITKWNNIADTYYYHYSAVSTPQHIM